MFEMIADIALNVVGKPLLALVKGLTDYRSMAVVGGTLVGILALVPEASRNQALVDSLLSVMEQTWFTFLGWIVALVIGVGAAFWILVLNTSRRTQGEKLSELRDATDPDRMSTTNDDVPNYSKMLTEERAKQAVEEERRD